MKRTIAIFVAGMLAGGSMMHLFRTAQSIDHIDSRAGTDAESAAVPVRDTDAAPTNAADDSAATASADRDALAALDEALAIGNAHDRQQAIGRAIEHLDALPVLDRAQLARPFAARFAAADPDAAIEWMLEQPGDVSSSLLGSGAHYLRDDPALAERYLDRVPAQVRAQWIRITAQAHALSDPETALDWIENFRGSREYGMVQNEVLTTIATYDGATAAALIDSRALWSQRPTVDRVIDGWFYYDPGAASAWAAGIPERLARQAALTFVGNSWARLDSDSAMSFVAGLWDRFEAALAP